MLLLAHLSPDAPRTILDMGCGYGALGLPIAAHFPNAKVEMVDRDLLAVKWAQKNADENHLKNVSAFGSLGFREIAAKTYDWILCNVPARIGTPFIQNLIEEGNAHLNASGELRVVVINDLVPVLEELKNEFHWDLNEVVRGPRHSVFSMKKSSAQASEANFKTLYLRDQIIIEKLTFDRPFDIGGDDQRRLKVSLPILIDALPRAQLNASQTVLCFRGIYGVLPLIMRSRSPDAQILSIDRDLLGTTFTRHNSERLNLAGPHLEVREAPHFPDGVKDDERFDLILGESSPSAGEAVARFELKFIQSRLQKGGQALILVPTKDKKQWDPAMPILEREGYSVLRIV